MKLVFQAIWRNTIGVRLWLGDSPYVVTEHRRQILRQDVKVELGGLNGERVPTETILECLSGLMADLKKANPGIEFGAPTLDVKERDGSPSSLLH